jgi:hypothetical protein
MVMINLICNLFLNFMRLINHFRALAIATGLIALLGCSPAQTQVPTSTTEMMDTSDHVSKVNSDRTLVISA